MIHWVQKMIVIKRTNIISNIINILIENRQTMILKNDNNNRINIEKK